MEREELRELNNGIASLHDEDDVYSYEIDKSKRIKFPRGFLRTLNENRGYITFIADEGIKTKIAKHMMLRDTLHWLWLKTDIIADARQMLIKNQLINLGSIVEAIANHMTEEETRRHRANVYVMLDCLNRNGNISNETNNGCKSLWQSRKQIHLHLVEEDGEIEYSDDNYIQWHESVGNLINELLGEG